METMNVRDLELIEGRSDADAAMRVRFNFPLQAAAGTKASAVVYFEIAPGEHLGRHTDSAEEILYIIQGSGEAIVGDERVPIEAGSLAVVPELVPHAVYNTGDTALEVVGFFAASELEHVFDEPIQPLGVQVVHTPFVPAPA
jgi:quercetin dioxygenase-like cupin family protein